MMDFWDERYGSPEYVYGESPNDYFRDGLKGIPPGKLLLPCEGEGRNAVHAARLGWEATAFDQSGVGKKKAESLAQKHAVQIFYSVADVESIAYPEGSFDALALIYAHFPQESRRRYHQKLAAYLKGGGLLILEAFSKLHTENQQQNPNSGGPRDTAMLYGLDELLVDFEGFDFREAKSSTIPLNEGNHHQGQASVIRILATKR